MIKNEISYKSVSELTLNEKSLVVKTIYISHFTKKESGEEEYTPVFKEYGKVLAFAMYSLQGVTFEEDEDQYECVMNDDDIHELYEKFIERDEFWDLEQDVFDMVEFKKQQLIHKKDDSISKYVEELIKLQVENEKLQKKAIEQTIEINSKFSKEETLQMTASIGKLSESLKDPEVQKNLVEYIAKTNLQGHKKPSTRKKKEVKPASEQA
jgi:hypothetical protein